MANLDSTKIFGNLIVSKTAYVERISFSYPSLDDNYNGNVAFFGSSGTFTAGDVVTFNSSGQWVRADADVESTSYGLMGVALGTSAASNGILLNGTIRASIYSGFATGVPLYLSETAGDFTTTKPTATNTIVRVLGYKVGTNTIYFTPDNTWIKNT